VEVEEPSMLWRGGGVPRNEGGFKVPPTPWDENRLSQIPKKLVLLSSLGLEAEGRRMDPQREKPPPPGLLLEEG